jgi:hypothetical protein
LNQNKTLQQIWRVFTFYNEKLGKHKHLLYSRCLEQEVYVMAKAKSKDYATTAPKEPQVTISNGEVFPNQKNIAGDSVDGHKALEEANIIISGDEIGQQNENL